MSVWITVGLYAAIVLLVGMLLIALPRVLSSRRYRGARSDSYECGVPVLASARERFPVHFYLVAILFVLFDIEVVFLIPWAVQCAELGARALAAVLVFLATIVFGLVYEWKRGALEWE